jgi:hypothetical protein
MTNAGLRLRCHTEGDPKCLVRLSSGAGLGRGSVRIFVLLSLGFDRSPLVNAINLVVGRRLKSCGELRWPRAGVQLSSKAESPKRHPPAM